MTTYETDEPDTKPEISEDTCYCWARREPDGYARVPDTNECLDSYNIDWDTERFICWQPDEMDNFYLNLIVWCPKRNILFRSNSIDWNFT